jgi:exopolysaccharide production protein ExoZ
MKSDQTVENIQALRGIAALLVVWAHLKFVLGPLCPSVSENLFVRTAHGGIGVDIFFIISGYVICLAACKRHHHPLDFFLARIARVSPLYLLAFFPAYAIKDLAAGPSLSWRSVWNGIFYLPVFDVGDFTQPPVGVGWTLSFEMWFYVVFALMLFIWKPAKVAVALPIFFFVGAILMVFYHGFWYFPRFAFHPFVLEFACGCIVFQTQRWVNGAASLLLLTGGIVAALVFTRHTGYLGWHLQLFERMDYAWLRLVLWGLPSALAVAGLVGLERNYGYLLPSPLVGLGAISYSLYLTHRFSLAVLVKLGMKIGLHTPALIVPLAFALSISVAFLCWKFVERPLTSRAQKWAKSLASPALAPKTGPSIPQSPGA